MTNPSDALHAAVDRATDGNAMLREEIARLRDALQVAAEFIRDELSTRLRSYCIIGPDGEPDVSTLGDDDGGSVAEAMHALERVNVALGIAS